MAALLYHCTGGRGKCNLRYFHEVELSGLRLDCFTVAVVADESESPPADAGDRRESHCPP
jgi:hypothetical protein